MCATGHFVESGQILDQVCFCPPLEPSKIFKNPIYLMISSERLVVFPCFCSEKAILCQVCAKKQVRVAAAQIFFEALIFCPKSKNHPGSILRVIPRAASSGLPF